MAQKIELIQFDFFRDNQHESTRKHTHVRLQVRLQSTSFIFSHVYFPRLYLSPTLHLSFSPLLPRGSIAGSSTAVTCRPISTISSSEMTCCQSCCECLGRIPYGSLIATLITCKSFRIIGTDLVVPSK